MRSFPWDSIVEAMGDDGLPIYDRAYSAEDFRNVMQVFFSNGVFVNSNTALQVTAGEGMTVTVAPGKGLINGTTAWEQDARTLEVTEAGTNPRIDTVVLRWDANLEERKIDLHIIKGTAGANPKRPNLTRTESVYELGLADIFIPANSTSIGGDRITDTRLESERCGVASPFMKIDTTTFYSQLEAALEKQTSELQEQTDKAVALAQNALDGTTAGNLQNQIDKAVMTTDTSIVTDLTVTQWFAKGSVACDAAFWADTNVGNKMLNGTILSVVSGAEINQVFIPDKAAYTTRPNQNANGMLVRSFTKSTQAVPEWTSADPRTDGETIIVSEELTPAEWEKLGTSVCFASYYGNTTYRGYHMSGIVLTSYNGARCDQLFYAQAEGLGAVSSTSRLRMFSRVFYISDGATTPKWELDTPAPGSITEDMLSSELSAELGQCGEFLVSVATGISVKNMTFPKAFPVAPVVICSLEGVHNSMGKIYIGTENRSETGCSFVVNNQSGSNIEFKIAWYAAVV